MEIEKYMQFIRYIENKYDVDKWIIGNVHVWPLIRIKLGLYISYYNQNKMIEGEEKKQFNRENIEFEEIKPSVIDEWLDKNYDAVFLTHTGVKTNVEGVWYDRFCDYLIEQFKNMDEESLVLEYTTSDRYKGKVNICSYRISEEANYYLNQHYNDEEYNNFNYNLDKYDMFFKETFEFLKSIKYDMPAFTIDWIISEIKQIRIIADYFKNILACVSPKMAFVVCYYTNIGFAFNLACRELNIASVDLQHGYNNQYHYSYASWNKLPKDGYELLPKFFWCWSEDELKLIKQWNYNNETFHKALDGGNTWLALWENVKNKINNYSNPILTKLKEETYIKILYTQSEHMDDFVFEAIEKSPENWRWLIRFHPLIPEKLKNIIINKLKKLNNKNVEYNIEDIPLFALMECIDVNVTTASSTIIESQYFGKKSVVTTKNGEKIYKNLVDSGLVQAAYNSEELLNAIKIQIYNDTVYVKNQNINNKISKVLKKIENYAKYLETNYTTQTCTQDNIKSLLNYNYKNYIQKCIEFNVYGELLKYYNLVNNEEQFREIINEILQSNTFDKYVLKEFILSEETINIFYNIKDSKIKGIFDILLNNNIISINECINIVNIITNIKIKFQRIRLAKCILFQILKYIVNNFSDYEDRYYYIFENYINVSFDYIEYVYNIDGFLDDFEEIFDDETKFIIYIYLYKNNKIIYDHSYNSMNDIIKKAEQTIPHFKKFLFNKEYKIEIIGDSFGIPRNEKNSDIIEVRYEDTYPEQLRKLFDRNNMDGLIINSCRRANNTFWLIKNHLNEIKLNQPDYIVIQLGIVDCWLNRKNFYNELYPDFKGKNPWVTEDEYINNLKLFIDYAFKYVSNLKKIFILNISKAKNEQYEIYLGSYEQTVKYNKRLDELNKIKNVHVIDIYEIFNNNLEKVLCSDGLHPNRLGNILITNKIFEELNKHITKDHIDKKIVLKKYFID